jgi:hypothetical protein
MRKAPTIPPLDNWLYHKAQPSIYIPTRTLTLQTPHPQISKTDRPTWPKILECCSTEFVPHSVFFSFHVLTFTQANKALQGAGGGFSFFGGRTEKYEAAADLYTQAANAFRMQKQSMLACPLPTNIDTA